MDTWSSLNELSSEYTRAAAIIRTRLAQLRSELKVTRDKDHAWHIERRIAYLTPILTEMNQLAEVTSRYYERGYYRNEKYCTTGIPKEKHNSIYRQQANDDSTE